MLDLEATVFPYLYCSSCPNFSPAYADRGQNEQGLIFLAVHANLLTFVNQLAHLLEHIVEHFARQSPRIGVVAGAMIA